MNNVKLVIIIGDKGFMVLLFNTTKGDTTMETQRKHSRSNRRNDGRTMYNKAFVVFLPTLFNTRSDTPMKRKKILEIKQQAT